MSALKNNRQERFCQEVITGCSQEEAAMRAGFAPVCARPYASRLLQQPDIQARVRELQEMATSSKVMNVIRRKEQLSEIAGTQITDFMAADDDPDIKVGKNTPGTAAIQSIQTRIIQKGGDTAKVTDIKLHDPIRAIAELNKMEGTYPPEKHQIAGANGPIEIVVKYANDRKSEKPTS